MHMHQTNASPDLPVAPMATPIDKNSIATLSDRLKRAVAHRGISQAEVARLSKVAASTITNVISGESKSLRKVITISKVLKVRPEWLAEGLGTMQDTSSTNQDGARMMALSEDECIVIKFLHSLPPEVQKQTLVRVQRVILESYNDWKSSTGTKVDADHDDLPRTLIARRP